MTATLPANTVTISHGRLQVSYSTHNYVTPNGPCLDLPSYRQQDVHSCGFVAALTVARYFDVGIDAKDVLKAVRPSINWGVNRFQLLDGLKSLGISSHYRTDLTQFKLRQLCKAGFPVILSVWPDEWLSDHWTVLRGFDDEMSPKRVYLTNFKSLTPINFARLWSDMDKRNGQGGSREGIVCSHDD